MEMENKLQEDQNLDLFNYSFCYMQCIEYQVLKIKNATAKKAKSKKQKTESRC